MCWYNYYIRSVILSMITMEELQGYPVADDKEIVTHTIKAVSLIEHNVDEF